MCLIICEKGHGQIPTEDELKRGYSSNPDGIGIAWKDNGGVYFKKSIGFGEMLGRLKYAGRNKLPYIVHFRVATIGGRAPQLCHPFPLTTKPEDLFRLEGRTKGVLAHNGTWRSWDKMIEDKSLVKRIENANWSDSAVIAWLLSQGKTITLSQIGYGHRIAVLSVKRGLDLYGDFMEDPKTGINYSNRYWNYTTSNYGKSRYESFWGGWEDDLDGDACSLESQGRSPVPVDELIKEEEKKPTLLLPAPKSMKMNIFQKNRPSLPKPKDMVFSGGETWRYDDDRGWHKIQDAKV